MKSVYPHHVRKKVAARFLEMNKGDAPNPAIKVLSTHTENGKMVTIQFEEVAPENMGQRLADYMKTMMKYEDIEGFEYEVRGTFTVEEALKLVE
ncbi:MAG: hypothetical protein ACTSRK_10400 [Promethearchaeota archaeon]